MLHRNSGMYVVVKFLGQSTKVDLTHIKNSYIKALAGAPGAESRIKRMYASHIFGGCSLRKIQNKGFKVVESKLTFLSPYFFHLFPISQGSIALVFLQALLCDHPFFKTANFIVSSHPNQNETSMSSWTSSSVTFIII